MKKGISLVGIKERQELEGIIDAYPDAYFELSYAMSQDFLEENRDILMGRTASIHSLSPRREFFPNLAAKDGNTISWSLEEITRDSDLALEIGASILVLHPGYLLPSSVPSSSEKRIALLRGKDLEPYIADPGSSICTWDYPESRLYRSAFERMWKNLHSISSRLEEKGIILAAENLNPRAGYMLILPDEMLELARLEHIHFCLDIGHMWITSILFHFDYLKAVRDILDTGKVITSHIHSNPSRPGLYRDTHESVYKYGLPYKEVLGMLNEAGCNMMLETVEEPEKNLEILFN